MGVVPALLLLLNDSMVVSLWDLVFVGLARFSLGRC